MRILIEAHHPAHIHFWKLPIRELQLRGHEVLMIARDRDVMRQLLEAYDWIHYTIPTRASKGKKNLFPAGEMFRRQWAMFQALRTFQPHLMMSLMGSYAQMARLFRIPSWIFTDSEFQHFNHRIAHPFASRIYTPECFYKPLGGKQIRYKGYHELSFLNQDQFNPNAEVLSNIGNAQPRDYVIVRTSAWDTLHDWKHSGLGDQLYQLVETIQKTHAVWIVAEGGKLPSDLERYRFQAPAHLFHDALAFARLVVTEGASTASEATCLGVPAFYINNTEPRGYLLDQSKRYGWPVCQGTADGLADAVQRCLLLTRDESEYAGLRTQVTSDHVNVSQWIVEEVEEAFEN